jgi:hypothetical protein
MYICIAVGDPIIKRGGLEHEDEEKINYGEDLISL